jgi:hypothetical protein
MSLAVNYPDPATFFHPAPMYDSTAKNRFIRLKKLVSVNLNGKSFLITNTRIPNNRGIGNFERGRQYFLESLLFAARMEKNKQKKPTKQSLRWL